MSAEACPPSARHREPKPEWLKVRAPGSPNYVRLKQVMGALRLNTVCEQAHCPNIGECWHHGTATFMLLGDVCTHGRPAAVDVDEPVRVGQAVSDMGLGYVVLTSVNRDDLADGGASIFAATVREIRRRHPAARIEVLIPDFQGKEAPLRAVLDASPDVLNHNIETAAPARMHPTSRRSPA
jgi:lipoic acid synthetase